MTELDKRHRSSIYDSMVKSPNRAMLRATGMTDKDFETPIVGGFPANIQAGKLQEEASKRCSGNQTITAITALLIRYVLAGVCSRTVGNQGTLNASLSEPQLTLKTMAETKPGETPGRKPGLR
ncbi:hypothetical protein [Corynebacterium matruchotii]|uniref:hypothetical protein n=1 Tax=Corynebacterium matruchotii TaxID=43768 RepID=UPI00360AF77B